MATIPGIFLYEEPFHALLGDVMRPVVAASARIGDRSAPLELHIDTGADYTLLTPTDARILLGDAYHRIDFERDAGRFDLYGISGDASGFVIRSATLTFRDDRGAPLSIDLPVLVARPSSPQPTPVSNWEMPSLLGCDVLRYFDLALSYNPPTVTLTEATPA